VWEGDELLVFLGVDSSFPVDFIKTSVFADFKTNRTLDIILEINLFLGIVKVKNYFK
jgi:hypothetical protein